MDLHLIAIFKCGKKLTGLRLLDIDAPDGSKVIDIQEKSLIDKIKQNSLQIRGIQLDGSGLVASNGQFERYPYKDVSTNKFGKMNHFTIIKKTDEDEYMLQNYKGDFAKTSESFIIQSIESKKIQLQNGKLVTRENGTKFISAISGSFQQVKQAEKQKEQATENKEQVKIADKAEAKAARAEAKAAKIAEHNRKTIETTLKNSKNLDKVTQSMMDYNARLKEKAIETLDSQQELLRHIIETENSWEDLALSQQNLRESQKQLKEKRESAYKDLNLTPKGLANLKQIQDKAHRDALMRRAANSAIQDRLGKTTNCRQMPIVKETEKANKIQDILESEITYTVNNKSITKQLNVRDKIVAVLNAMKKCSPYYFWVIQGLKLIETDSVDTAGATIESIVYNPNYINKLTIGEIAFLFIHEASHVLMRHCLRSKGKNHIVFNIAADLYINKNICEEFNINPLVNRVGKLADSKQNTGLDMRNAQNVEIAFVDQGLYQPLVDTQVNTPEQIYLSLIEEMKKEMQNGDNSNQGQSQQGQQGQQQNQPGQGQQGQNQSGQGQQGQNQSGQGQQGQNQSSQGQQGQGQQGQGQQGQGQQGQGQQGQGQSQSGQGQQGQGQSQYGQGQQGQGQQGQNQSGQGQSQSGQGQSQSGQGQSQSGQGQGQQGQGQSQSGQGQQGQNQGQDQGQNQGQGHGQRNDKLSDEELAALKKVLNSKFGVDIKGEDFESDLVEDQRNAGDSPEAQEQRAKNVASGVQARIARAGAKQYSTGLSQAIQRQIEMTLAPVVNWKRALRQMMHSQKTTEDSYQRPKRQYLSQNLVLPQEVPGNPDTVGTVLVAIDTSGSIQNKDIGAALKQVQMLLKKFKQKGIIMYWDTAVRAKADFSSLQEALRLRPAGGGGTDPACIFENIMNDKRFKQKVHKHNIEAILIFTDGYIPNIEETYKKRFGRKTIWIISDPKFAENGWKAPMGITAPFKTE